MPSIQLSRNSAARLIRLPRNLAPSTELADKKRSVGRQTESMPTG